MLGCIRAQLVYRWYEFTARMRARGVRPERSLFALVLPCDDTDRITFVIQAFLPSSCRAAASPLAG